MEILILFFSLLAIENLQRYFIFNFLIVNFAFSGNDASNRKTLQSVFSFSLGCWLLGFRRVLLLLRTLFQDEKIIVAKDLNWNKMNWGFKFMLFCESQARFSTQVFSLFNFAEFASMANLAWVVVKLATQANSASIWAFTSDPWSITPETGLSRASSQSLCAYRP